MRAILNAIWKGILAVVIAPFGLVADAIAQSDRMPAPVRQAAQRFTDERQAKLVRRYCRALADGEKLPRIVKLSQATQDWLGRIEKAEAGRVALMSSEDILRRLNGGRGDETPKPRNSVPFEVRQRMRRARWEARQMKAPAPEIGPEPTTPRLSP